MSDLLPGVPASWTPYMPLVGTLVRAALTAVGTWNVAWAQSVTADQMQQIVGVVMVLAALVWSAWQKAQAQKRLDTAAASMPGPPPKLPT